MRILIYSDPHVTKYPPGLMDVRRESLLQLFEQLYPTDSPLHDVDFYVCLGDFFHTSRLEARDVDYIKKLSSRIRYHTLILTGNHDRSSPDDSLVDILDAMNPNVRVVKKTYVYEDLVFVSHGYMRDLENLCEQYGLDKRDSVLFTHEDYVNLQLNTTGQVSKSGYHKDLVRDFRHVFNGHIHLPSRSGNIVNVGSIAPIAFGELPYKVYPSYYVYDTVDFSLEQYFVNTPVIPWSIHESDMEEFIKEILLANKVRLRVLYESDQPEYPIDCNRSLVSLEYKKILKKPTSIDVESGETVEVDDVIVQVPFSVERLLSKDTSLEDPMRESLNKMSNEILRQVSSL